MPASNLAKVFGPTVVGYSSLEPEPMQMISETRKQQLVSCVISANRSLKRFSAHSPIVPHYMHHANVY